MASETAGSNADAIEHVVVVGYDHWTEAVLTTLDELEIGYALIVTDDAHGGPLGSHDAQVVHTEALNEAAFREAGADRADAVLVATFDDRLNVLAVLTAIEVVEDATIATFSDERRDAAKLKRAGADTVVNLGPVVAELLVDSALTGDDPRALLDVLLADESVVDSEALERETAEKAPEDGRFEPTGIDPDEDEEVPATTSELASESIDVAPEESEDDGQQTSEETAIETDAESITDQPLTEPEERQSTDATES